MRTAPPGQQNINPPPSLCQYRRNSQGVPEYLIRNKSILCIEQIVGNPNRRVSAPRIGKVHRERRHRAPKRHAGVSAIAPGVRPRTQFRRNRLGAVHYGPRRNTWCPAHCLAHQEHGLRLHSELDTRRVQQVFHLSVGYGCYSGCCSGQ